MNLKINECECGNLTTSARHCEDCREAQRRINVRAIRNRRAAMREADMFARPARVRR